MLFLETAWVEPEGFEPVGGQISSHKIYSLACLVYQGYLECGNVVSREQTEYLVFDSEEFLLVDENTTPRRDHNFDMYKAGSLSGLDLHTGNGVSVHRLTEHGRYRLFGHTDKSSGSLDT